MRVLKKGLLVALTCLLYTNICCTPAKEKPVSHSPTVKKPIDSPIDGYPIEKYMRRSEFGIVGKLRVKTKDVKVVTGSIEVTSLIYGDPKTKEIPFSVSPFPYWMDSDGGEGFSFAHLISFMIPTVGIGQGIDLILLGKDTGGNITLICPLELTALSYVKEVKKMENMDKQGFLKEREKLLTDSIDLPTFGYLYRRSLMEEGVEGALVVIKALGNVNKATSNQKLLAYDLTFEVLEDYPSRGKFLTEYLLYTHYYGKQLPPMKAADESQKKELVDVILNLWKNTKTVEEGLDYIADRNTQNLTQGGELEKQIQRIANSLSGRFKNDKAYPEWEKWVNKIFPAEEKTEK